MMPLLNCSLFTQMASQQQRVDAGMAVAGANVLESIRWSKVPLTFSAWWCCALLPPFPAGSFRSSYTRMACSKYTQKEHAELQLWRQGYMASQLLQMR
jgi:hypothetical protein